MDGIDGAVLVIRADANPAIGTGHFMRSLALGQAWRLAGGRVAFLTVCSQESLLRRLERERFQIHGIAREHPDPRDLQDTLAVARSEEATWVSIDGYFFDPGYHDGITTSDRPLMALDDNAHLNRYFVDVLLNQNIHAGSLDYRTRPETKRLLGTRYVLLRQEFLERKLGGRPTPDIATHLLVTLGGSDPDNLTSRVLAGIDQVNVEGLKATIVVGPDNPHFASLRRAARKVRHSVDVTSNVERMAELMSGADLAICGGGTTLWELAYLGVPVISLVRAENQRRAVAALESKGMLLSLGEPNNFAPHSLRETVETLARDASSRARMAEVGRNLVDGGGARRVLKTLAAVGDRR